MSEMRLEKLTMPAARLGPENPLPPLMAVAALRAAPGFDVSVQPEDREYFGWGSPSGLLPYRLQDSYDRNRVMRDFNVVVLENEHLRATFFPELGGRLWSLVHKATGRELFSRNPVFQPANLALRNAWFSGGVEWNIGWTGHWPYTCSPLFAARVRTPDGTPVLRMWEWERVRQVPFQIDAWLPDDSKVLFVRVSIRNPHRDIVPMYWWSNIAVEVNPDTRVLVSAANALVFDSKTNTYLCVDVPCHNEEPDSTYPARFKNTKARDYFYCVPAEARPWIAAVAPSGRGLFQTSTMRLRGRKLFRWGTLPGSQHWQDWLKTPAYIEIQAGLARTQRHNIPMPPDTTWSWLEAYGDMNVEPDAAYGEDWDKAQQTAKMSIDSQIPAARMDAVLKESGQWAEMAPSSEPFCTGTGWGSLETARRKHAGETELGLPGIFFPVNTMDAEQQPWKTLLETGRFPACDPKSEPGSFMVQSEWMALLGKSLMRPEGRHWNALFHFGLMLWHNGRSGEAVSTWKESLRKDENPWAEYCLGSASLAARPDKAARHFERAFAIRPDLMPLAAIWISALLKCGKHRKALKAADTFPAAMRNAGRILILVGRALLDANKMESLEKLLQEQIIIPDMREGENTTSDLWIDMYAKRLAKARGVTVDDKLRQEAAILHPVPRHLDFRM